VAPSGDFRSSRTGAVIRPTGNARPTKPDDLAEIDNLAAAEADRLSPRLRYDAPVYGTLGGAATYLIIVIFGRLSGTNPDAAYWPTIIVVGLGACLPYLFARYRAREHSRRYVEACTRLEAERAAKSQVDAQSAKPDRSAPLP